MKTNKRLLAALMTAVMVLTLVPFSLFAFAEAELGSEENPYEIDSIADLQALKDAETEGKYYKITKDLNATKENLETWFNQTGNPQIAANVLKNGKVETTTFSAVNDVTIGEDNYSDYYVNDESTGTEIDSVTGYKYRAATAEDTAETPYTKNTNISYTAFTSFSDIPEASYATLLASEDVNVSATTVFTPITTFKGTLYGAGDNGITISGLTINAVESDGKLVAGLFVTVDGGTVDKLNFDNTCTVNALTTSDGVTVVAATIAVKADNKAAITNCSSAAVINVSNKLYTEKVEDNETTNTSATYAGGIVGQIQRLSYVSKSTYSGTINFAYAEGSFASGAYEKIYSNAVVKLGGIASEKVLAVVNDDCTVSCTLNSTFIGAPGVKGGKSTASANDLTVNPSLDDDDKTFATGTEVDIYGNAGSEANISGKYQLVIAEKAGSPTVAYIRTKTCTHDNLTPTAKVAATCSSEGNYAYWVCDDCGKYFSDADATTEITQADTVEAINPDNHTKNAEIKAKDPTCAAIGYSCDCSYCADCGRYYDTDGLLETSTVERAMIDHTYGEYVYNNDATTTKEGTETRTCTECGAKDTRTKAGTMLASVTPKSSSGYAVKTVGGKACLDNVIVPGTKGITVTQFVANLNDGNTYIVRDLNGNPVTGNTKVATGFTVEISGYETQTKLTIIVKGDINQDGAVNSKDYIKIRKHILGTALITDSILAQAADYDNNGKIKSADYVKVKKVILASK